MNILLVEDSRSDSEILREFLAERTHVPVVHWVTDGAQALDFVHRKAPHENAPRPDMILLDLGLPRIPGYEVLKKLKEDAALAAIPVVVLTTSQNPDDRKVCLRLGADGFLSKPSNLGGYETLVDHIVDSEFARLTPTSPVSNVPAEPMFDFGEAVSEP